jgi:hypothetical protein
MTGQLDLHLAPYFPLLIVDRTQPAALLSGE